MMRNSDQVWQIVLLFTKKLFNVHYLYSAKKKTFDITETIFEARGWPEGHVSEVCMEMEEKKDHTELRLTQKDIPAGEYESMESNWDRYYWNSIKKTFGFGAFFT